MEQIVVRNLSADGIEVKKLIDRIGWRSVILGLLDIAERQKAKMLLMKLNDQAKTWDAVREKVRMIRKNVQM